MNHYKTPVCLLILSVAALILAQPGAAPAEDKTLSPYFLVKSDDPAVDRLPLLSTSADVNVAGVIADVVVTQVYKNDGKKPIEAIYTFPASTRAAVYGMRMTIGKRTIIAEIREREQARQDYEHAKQEGKSASLLEQQRPNVFQMNVANIMPGDTIKVELRYTELLIPTDGVYEFAYPTVVGPRYSNVPEKDAPKSENWVKSPYQHEGEAPLYDFGMSVRLEAGLPIQDISCPSHKVNLSYDGLASANVALDPTEKAGGNRDFILHYRLAGGKIESGLLLSQGKDEDFFLLMLQPPKKVAVKDIPPREYIFIMDVSGSMHGFPIDISKTLLRNLLTNLRPTDYFNVLLLAASDAVLSEKSLPATKENIEDAIAEIDKQSGGGGTELLPALKRALALPHAEGTSRTVVIATDGYVTVETEAFDLIRDNLGKANMFAFGIGSSVNRLIIEGMAHVGMGEPFVIEKPEAAAAQAEKFRKYIQTPVLAHVAVSFNGFDAYDVEPKTIPDVLAERPIIVFGKWRGRAGGTITVSGYTGAGKYKQTVNVGQYKPSLRSAALRYLWARHRVQLLADYNNLREDPGRVKEVTQLGIKYNLLTQYTSFVAIDQQVRNVGGKTEVVKQALPMPQGVSDYAIGGGASAGFAGRSLGAGKSAAPAPPMMRQGVSVERYMAADELQKTPTQARQGSVLVSKLVVSAGLTKKQVKDVLEKKLADIRQAYSTELAASPGLTGSLSFGFTIGIDGKATGFASDKNTVGAALEQAVIEVLKKLQFPKPAAPVNVTLLLAFKP